MPKNLFVINLKYIVELETITQHKEAHLKFIKEHFENGTLLLAGPQVPRFGGIILAQGKDRKSVENLMAQDPFAIHRCAEFQITEFKVTKTSKVFQNILEQI